MLSQTFTLTFAHIFVDNNGVNILAMMSLMIKTNVSFNIQINISINVCADIHMTATSVQASIHQNFRTRNKIVLSDVHNDIVAKRSQRPS